MGVADQVGTLETGKRANVVVTAGHLLQPTTPVLALFIDGEPVRPESRHTQLYAKYRHRLDEVRAGRARLGIDEAPTKLSGTRLALAGEDPGRASVNPFRRPVPSSTEPDVDSAPQALAEPSSRCNCGRKRHRPEISPQDVPELVEMVLPADVLGYAHAVHHGCLVDAVSLGDHHDRRRPRDDRGGPEQPVELFVPPLSPVKWTTMRRDEPFSTADMPRRPTRPQRSGPSGPAGREPSTEAEPNNVSSFVTARIGVADMC